MTQPVRVGLYFPRSGQELYVQLPIPVAETADSRRHDTMSNRAETTSAVALNGPGRFGDFATHTR